MSVYSIVIALLQHCIALLLFGYSFREMHYNYHGHLSWQRILHFYFGLMACHTQVTISAAFDRFVISTPVPLCLNTRLGESVCIQACVLQRASDRLINSKRLVGCRPANIEWQPGCMLSGGMQLMWNMPVSIIIMVNFRASALSLLQIMPCLSIKGSLMLSGYILFLCSDCLLTSLRQLLWTIP